ncbi:MAG: peptidoglycan-binding protein [Clostridia bacterium]|nr:peptidoglycan-binding protein [Clostridia bacterium]MBR4457980.1 peptidoglycan-binding protein [Clostridia bacterium]
MKKTLTLIVTVALLLCVTLSASAVTMLQEGDRGASVKKLQQALVSGGWADLKCDGVYGPKTAAAVKYYQQMNGLVATGRAGSITLTQLLGTPDVDLNKDGENTMGKGSNGPAVLAVQQKLKALGYYKGALDGKFGNGTLAAVKSFQTLNGLRADGKVGSKTLAKLDAADAVPWHATITYSKLRRGSTGSAVVKLQTALKAASYYSGAITGYFSLETELAVRNFQTANNLKVDGIAGQQTQSLLYGTP